MLSLMFFFGSNILFCNIFRDRFCNIFSASMSASYALYAHLWAEYSWSMETLLLSSLGPWAKPQKSRVANAVKFSYKKKFLRQNLPKIVISIKRGIFWRGSWCTNFFYKNKFLRQNLTQNCCISYAGSTLNRLLK